MNKQAARIRHTTAKRAAMVVAEMAQAAKLIIAVIACKHTCHQTVMIMTCYFPDSNSKGDLIVFEYKLWVCIDNLVHIQ